MRSTDIKKFLTAIAVGTALAPRVASAAALCNASGSTSRIVCYETYSYPHIQLPYTFSAGTWEIESSDLANLPGHSNTVDPAMWLLNLGTGAVVAVDNDSGIGLAPKISVTVAAPFSGLILVAGRTSDRQGRTDVAFRKNGVYQFGYDNLWFGGWRITSQNVKIGDRMFVGAPREPYNFGAIGTSLFVMSNATSSCTSNCGTFQRGEWKAGTLDQLTANFTASSAGVLVGAHFDGSVVGTRWFHSRLGGGWSGSGYADADCDGLTSELEALANSDPNLNVGTCDSPSGPSADCAAGRQFEARVEGFQPGLVWSAADTDNDGLRDDWELYGTVFRCDSLPTQPYPHPGFCVDATYNVTHATCTAVSEPSAATWSNALSLLDPDPREYDSFVQVTSHSTMAFQPATLAQLEYIFGEEGLECDQSDSTSPTFCPGELLSHNRIRLHLYPHTSGVPLEERRNDGVFWLTESWFNAAFAQVRNFTRTFDHAYLREFDSTLAANGGRTTLSFGMVLMGGVEKLAEVFAHETGHALGLMHMNGQNFGSGDCVDKVLNYPSLMNYRWCASVGQTFVAYPSKADASIDNDLWHSDLGATCTTDANCPESGRCVSGACTPCSMGAARFSRGLQPVLRETTPGVGELGIPTNLAGWMACDTCYNQPPTSDDGWPVVVRHVLQSTAHVGRRLARLVCGKPRRVLCCELEPRCRFHRLRCHWSRLRF